MKNQLLISLIIFNFPLLLIGQSLMEIEFLIAENEIPPTLVETRSTIIINDLESTWREKAIQVHKQMVKMGIDPVIYARYQDIISSSTVNKNTISLLKGRNIAHLILLDFEGGKIKMAITKIGKTELVDKGATAWVDEGGSFDEVSLRLALKLKSMELKFKNFLIVDTPEFLTVNTLVSGTHFKNYPTYIKSAPLAVERFQKIKIDTTRDIGSKYEKTILEYNNLMDQRNRELETIFQNYPYKYEFVDEMPDRDLYNKRFQFVLRMIHTSGYTVKKKLSYDVNETETDYISIIPLPNDQRTLKTIPINQDIYKFYIKQTVVGDVHVGRYWDADITWQNSLSNFLLNMTNFFK